MLYVEGCASTPQTVQLIESVARDMGIPVEIGLTFVTSQGQAEALRFLGSPTVQANGQDIEPAVRHIDTFGLM